MNHRGSPISPEAVASEVIRSLAGAPEMLAAVLEHEDRLLTIDEIHSVPERRGLLPLSRPTVEKLVRDGRLPMFKLEGRWVITRKAFREAAAAGFPEPTGRFKKAKKRTGRAIIMDSV